MSPDDLARHLVQSVIDHLAADDQVVVAAAETAHLVDELEPLGDKVVALLGAPPSPNALDTLEEIVAELAERLLSSDHVDEVYAEDRDLRRLILQVVREVMSRAALDAPERRSTVVIDLGDLPPYVAVASAKLVDGAPLRAALERAANAAGADLDGYDEESRRAHFAPWDDEASGDRTPLRDAVAEELAHAGFARFAVDLDEADLPEAAPRETLTTQAPEAPRGESFATFGDFNFKLAVVQVLMYETTALRPRFDVHAFAAQHHLDLEAIESGIVPEVRAYFEALPIPVSLLDGVTSLTQDGGDRIYAQLSPGWDGEDGRFQIRSAEDAKWLRNLKRVALFSVGEAVLAGFRSLRVAVDGT